MSAPAATPAWLLRPEVGLCPCGCIGTRRKAGFVEWTISGAAGLLRQVLLSEDVASGRGLLQRLEPRVKVVALFGLLVVAAFVRHIPVLLGIYAATLALAAASKLSLSFFVKRVWLFIPIFTGIIVAPATLNVVTHGPIVVPLGSWFGHRLGLTEQGLTAAGLIVTRVATSISLVVLLTLTTPWSKLLAALRGLYAPRMFILVLGMAYRYLFHLLDAVTDMYTSRQARTVTRESNVASGRSYVAASAGALLGRAHALSEEVHQAMEARGYRGDSRSVSTVRVRSVDVAFAVMCIAGAVALIGIDRMLGA
ncbi:MAG: cobalt/nickel transport system permease protein [Actinomycetota bacterium]|jgi:cobalt ECF transporter T component CbiQ|nr:cobalt/nickel transport system permease protein [Actinomycetota bacterium]